MTIASKKQAEQARAESIAYTKRHMRQFDNRLTMAGSIRRKCLDCCAWQAVEVERCVMTNCALWPYRQGRDPFSNRRKG